jgi:hypothetical protein
MLAFATSAVFTATAHAQSAIGYLSVEGGLACSRNKSFLDFSPTDFKIGDNGCGGTGALEIGQTGRTVVGIFDHWALRGRLTSFDDKLHAVFGPGPVDLKMTDKRFVLDAELGTKLPLGLFGGTSRLVVGLRYATWSAAVDFADLTGNAANIDADTSGFGPRIGLRSSIPLGTQFMYESQTGIAALFSRHKLRETVNGVAGLEMTGDKMVYSIDSSSALSYKFNDAPSSAVASVGLFSEYWFGQSHVRDGADDFKRNRHSWGPFLRMRMPLQ